MAELSQRLARKLLKLASIEVSDVSHNTSNSGRGICTFDDF